MNIPTLYMLIGLPGSGKSHWANQQKIKIHSSDEIRMEIFDCLRQDRNQEVFSLLHNRIKESIKRREDCIYDATNLNRKKRIAFLNETKHLKYYKVAILFTTPINICIERNKQREGQRCIPTDIIWNMAKTFQIPLPNEGFDEIRFIPIDKETYFEPSYSFDILDELSQDNPHHKLTVGKHCLKASQLLYQDFKYSNIESLDKMLIYFAALNHDIGKLYTKTFINRSKNEITDIAHFYEHENMGAYMYISEQLNYNKKLNALFNKMSQEIHYNIACLINMHMRPLTAWKQSKKAEERDRVLLGDTLFHQLKILHEVDINAH